MRVLSVNRRIVLGAVCIALSAVVWSMILTASASVPPAPSSSADYFGSEWDDPMDFSNPEDFDTADNVMTRDGFAAMSGGRLNIVSTTPQSYTYLVKSVNNLYPTSTTRDSDLHPLDASVYTRISFRMYSADAGVAGMSYQTCEDNPPVCTRTKYFKMKAGWYTYDLDMLGTNEVDPYTTPAFTAGPAWSGTVRSIIFTPSVGQNYTANVTFDWLRIYQPKSPAPTNEPPIPKVIDPDELGGEDWATSVRGDPWDFSQATDVAIAENVNMTYSGGQGYGSSAGNAVDPLLIMNTNGLTIDTVKYSKASVRIRYGGTWGLQDFGGGMVGRFVWQFPGWTTYQVGDAFLVSTSPRSYTMDLKTTPATAALELTDTPNPVGWGTVNAPQASLFRFDPHEDRAPRDFVIDEIRLARNDRVNPRFTIRYQDQAWEAGTTAEIYADTDRSTGNGLGTRIASNITVNSGENQFIWDGKGVGIGSFWIHVVMTDPVGNVAGSYATGQLDVEGPPPTNPFGSLDTALGGPGRIMVAGWAVDPDSSSPIGVDVYVDDQGFNLGPAALFRSDVVPFGAGPLHGYNATLGGIAPGVHSVCAYGTNVGPGANNQLGCRTVVIPSGPPFGSLDGVSAGPGSVSVAGWAIDPDTASPIQVHVYVDGQGFNLGPVSVARADVGSAYPGFGPNHGYYATLGGIAPGVHNVCAYGINVGPGANNQLGCRTVVVPSGPPFGSLDTVARAGPGAVSVTGWAIDPDTASPIEVHVYVDGQGFNLGPVSASRADVAKAFPGYGPNHGFVATLGGIVPGPHTVCAYGINVGPGSSNQLGCGQVTV